MAERKRNKAFWRTVLLALIGSGAIVGLVVVALFVFNEPVEVSKETTFYTEPLREDGTVDYATALNRKYEEGLTQDNNALVPLLEAFGTREIPEPTRNAVLERLELGDRKLTRDGTFESLEEIFRRDKSGADHPKLRRLLRVGSSRPWCADAFPHLAEWLEANRQTLSLLQEAAERSRFYVPVVGPLGTLEEDAPGNALNWDHMDRGFDLMQIRAMKRLGAGEVEKASTDAATLYRLGRVLAEDRAIVSRLKGLAVQRRGVAVELAIARTANVGPDRLGNLRKARSDVPSLSPIQRQIDDGCRVETLGRIRSLDRGAGSAALDVWTDVAFSKNEAMRRVNDLYNEVRSASQKGGLSTRVEAVANILQKLTSDTPSRNGRDGDGVPPSRPKGLVPSVDGMVEFGVRTSLHLVRAALHRDALLVTERRLANTALALDAYRNEKKGYPSQLKALVPKFLVEMPADPCGDGALAYTQSEGGYRLYGVGPDGEDDGGLPGEERGDIVFGIPMLPEFEMLVVDGNVRPARKRLRAKLISFFVIHNDWFVPEKETPETAEHTIVLGSQDDPMLKLAIGASGVAKQIPGVGRTSQRLSAVAARRLRRILGIESADGSGAAR